MFLKKVWLSKKTLLYQKSYISNLKTIGFIHSMVTEQSYSILSNLI